MRTRSRCLWLVVLVATLGCSPGSRRAPSVDKRAHARNEARAVTATAVDVARDVAGFTITQDVAVTPDVRADYESAMRLAADGLYSPAIELLLGVIERAPGGTSAHIALGVAYARNGDLENAESSLRTALAVSPQHPVAYNELGLVQRRTGRFADSRASYEAALATYADFHYAHRNLAILCDLYLADSACALKHYEAYSRIVPNDGEVVKWIADLRYRAGAEDNR